MAHRTPDRRPSVFPPVRVISEPGCSHVTVEGGPPVSRLTVGGLLRVVAAEVPERVALAEPSGFDGTAGRSWTYARLLDEAERGARVLLQSLAPGEHLTVWAGNSPEWVILQYAASLAGVVLVAANPGLRKAEISYAISQSASVGVIYNRSYRDVDAAKIVAELAAEMGDLRYTATIDDWYALLPAAAIDGDLPVLDSEHPAMIQYTSGTTGMPKAAVLPHRSLVNCGQYAAHHFDLDVPPTWYMASPLFHTGGCVFGVLGTAWQHGTLLVPKEFDAAQMLHSVVADGAIGATMTPTMCLRILQTYAADPVDVTNLQIIVGGGASVAPELVRKLSADLDCEFLMVYGQTETGSAVTMSTRADDVTLRTDTVGRVFPNLEARIADPVDGSTVPPDAQGEIQLRGYMGFSGYLGMPAETEQTLRPDGWLRTGDLGTLSGDGYLTVTGRLKNVIIRGGEKIFPREVEDVLVAHPGVTDAAVFGVPDEYWGEVVAAVVIAATPGGFDAEALRQWLRERIARYKVPDHLTFVDEFPTTPTGKVQTFRLRDAVIEDRLRATRTIDGSIATAR